MSIMKLDNKETAMCYILYIYIYVYIYIYICVYINYVPSYNVFSYDHSVLELN
jgi:hypothetical protein